MRSVPVTPPLPTPLTGPPGRCVVFFASQVLWSARARVCVWARARTRNLEAKNVKELIEQDDS
jgi:hypothetical protein